jgi:hypothetical protein
MYQTLTSSTCSVTKAHETTLLSDNKPNTGETVGFQDSEFAFPFQMYDMLESAENMGFDSIVSWEATGNGFVIHDREKFVQYILPAYFQKQTRFRSFQRQLNFYNFFRVKSASKQGDIYTQQHFLRGKRKLCHLITRKPYQAKSNNTTKHNKSKKSATKKQGVVKESNNTKKIVAKSTQAFLATLKHENLFTADATSLFQSSTDSVLGQLDDCLFDVQVDPVRAPISCTQQRNDVRIQQEALSTCFSFDESESQLETFTSSLSSRCSEALHLVESLEHDEPISLNDCSTTVPEPFAKSDSSWLADHETMLHEFASHWDHLDAGKERTNRDGGSAFNASEPVLSSSTPSFDFIADEIISTFGLVEAF